MPPKGVLKTPSELGSVQQIKDGWRFVLPAMHDLREHTNTSGPVRQTKAKADKDKANARMCKSRKQMLEFVRGLRKKRFRADGSLIVPGEKATGAGKCPSKYPPNSAVEVEASGSDGKRSAKRRRSAAAGASQPAGDAPSGQSAAVAKRSKARHDVGGTLDEEEEDFGEDVGPDDISLHPLQDHGAALKLAMQQRTLDEIQLKKRKSKSDKALLLLDDSYGEMLRAQSFAFPAVQADSLLGMHFKDDFAGRLALQKQSIALAKKQLNADDVTVDDFGDAWMSNSGYQQDEEERDVEVVPLPLALKGPGAVAWQLLQDASCTEEQIDAVALLALSLQKRFDARPDKETLLCPVATPDNNHRAVWLGGGGVGKTHTLTKVLPMNV